MGQLWDVGIVTECASVVNPHNGGTCTRYEPQDDSDNASDDEQEAPESLPLVPRNADTIDSGTDSYVYGTSQMIILY